MQEENLSDDEKNQFEKKLLLLYLIDKMDLPLTQSQISEFAMEDDYINYFSLQQFLADMVEINQSFGKIVWNNTSCYGITD